MKCHETPYEEPAINFGFSASLVQLLLGDTFIM